MAVPPGAPWWILPLLSPIELLSNIFVRPFTLTIRLFANMLAGHLLLLVFALAPWYLFSASIGLLFAATSFVVTIMLTGLEVLIQALQAFIFTTLTAYYYRGCVRSLALNPTPQAIRRTDRRPERRNHHAPRCT